MLPLYADQCLRVVGKIPELGPGTLYRSLSLLTQA